ncbi:MAG: DUF4307 domain-containing protein [Corynebacterium sp.]|nr:DUF4307 domain-containing protein [Corynebacterium sp.]
MTSRTSRAATPASPSSSATGKVLAVIFFFLLLAAVVVVFQFTQKQQQTPVTATRITHQRLTDNTLRLTYDVHRRDVTQPSYCIILAWDYDKNEIGRREILNPVGGEEYTRIVADIPTRGVPIVGETYGCSDKVPAYLTEPPMPLADTPVDPTSMG